jgi:hypothetical protein
MRKHDNQGVQCLNIFLWKERLIKIKEIEKEMGYFLEITCSG